MLFTVIDTFPTYNVKIITENISFYSWTHWNTSLHAAQVEYKIWNRIWPDARIEILRKIGDNITVEEHNAEPCL